MRLILLLRIALQCRNHGALMGPGLFLRLKLEHIPKADCVTALWIPSLQRGLSGWYSKQVCSSWWDVDYLM